MGGFTKLFSTIIHSTIWRADMHVKVVWVTMLAMADQNGRVWAAVPGLADAARVSLPQCIEALHILSSPDEWSRTQTNEGRRIVKVDGGWELLNYLKYREARNIDERREQTRRAVAKHRAKARVSHVSDVSKVSRVSRSKPKQKQKQKKIKSVHPPRSGVLSDLDLSEEPTVPAAGAATTPAKASRKRPSPLVALACDVVKDAPNEPESEVSERLKTAARTLGIDFSTSGEITAALDQARVIVSRQRPGKAKPPYRPR